MTAEVAGSSPAPTQEAQTGAATANDFSAQQWAAAAAMQQYYGVKQPSAPAANNAAQYYAQMAQHPNLYAQMWATPVRTPAPTPLIFSPARASRPRPLPHHSTPPAGRTPVCSLHPGLWDYVGRDHGDLTH